MKAPRWLQTPWLGAAALVTMAACLIASALWASPTYDEPFHLTRGLAYGWMGDARLSVGHPPLANAVLAWPATWVLPHIDLTHVSGWAEANAGFVAGALWQRDPEGMRHALLLARGGMVVVTLVFAVSMVVWTRRAMGTTASNLTAILLATQPPLLAHGSLMTTDMPATATIAWALFATLRYINARGLVRVVILSVALAAAVATKYNGLVAGVVTIALTGVAVVRGRGRFATSWRGRVVRVIAEALGVVAIVLVLLASVYRFHDVGWSLHEMVRADPQSRLARDVRHPLHALPPTWNIPLPYPYVRGLASVTGGAKHGRRTYLFGRWRPRGVRWYFPLMLLVQLSTSAWLLGGVALAAWVRRSKQPRQTCAPSVVIFAISLVLAAILLPAVFSRINIGLRHVLPAVPWMCVMLAYAATPVFTRGHGWRAAGALCVVLGVGETLWTAPRFLGFYNMLAGGRHRGHRISIVGEDWGQDVGDLAAWARVYAPSKLYYQPYIPHLRAEELTHHGIHATMLSCRAPLPRQGVLAVHVSIAVRTCFPELHTRTPFHVIGEHIQLYALDVNP